MPETPSSPLPLLPPADTGPSDDTLEIVLPKSKFSLATKVASLAVLSLVFYLVMKAATILLTQRGLFSWWKANGGQQYSNFVSIFLLLNSVQGSALLGWIVELFRPTESLLNKSSTIFVTGHLLRFIRSADLADPSKQIGILTPKQLCQTTLLHKDDGDQFFSDWLKKNADTRVQGDTPLDPNYFLTFSAGQQWSGSGKSGLTFLGHQTYAKKGGNKYGIYPDPDDYESWKGCLQAWANGGLDQTVAKYVWIQDQDNKNFYTLQPVTEDASLKDWFNEVAQPDNFLGRYGILPTSPLVTFFANGKAYINGQSYGVNANMLKNLVGASFSGDDAGGWLGFLRGQKESTGADEFYNELYSAVDTDLAPKPAANCGGGWQSWLTGPASALPVALPLFAGGASGVIAATVLLAMTAWGSHTEATQGCQKPS
jgi:hypothetical protein